METRRKQSLAYLAGVIDSDGYIGVTKGKASNGNKHPKYSLTVNVTNTSEVLMSWLASNFGGTIYERKHPKNVNWKRTFNWVMTFGKAKDLLLEVEPYLVIKRDRALLGIELIEGWVTDNRGTPKEELSRRERIYREFRDLNATGLVQRERLSPEAPSNEG